MPYLFLSTNKCNDHAVRAYLLWRMLVRGSEDDASACGIFGRRNAGRPIGGAVRVDFLPPHRCVVILID